MLNLSSLPQSVFKINPIEKLPLQWRARMIAAMPKVLRPSLSLLPFKAQRAVLLPALSSVFREALNDGDFEFLQEKWLKIAITDLGLTWWLSFDKHKLIMASSDEMAANNNSEDVSFSATGDDLVLIAGRKQDPDTLFFQRRLKIEGDTELGLEVKNLIDAIDIEQLPSTVHSLVEYSANFLQSTKDELLDTKTL